MIDNAREFEVAVLGGGAAGIIAAISVARLGKSAVICEHGPRLGRKILASGNGRCNLSNENLSESFYNSPARPLVKSVFSKFGKTEILDFFKGLGLLTYSDNGRIFPVTNQSSSVLKVLEIELKRLAVPVELNFAVANINSGKKGFTLIGKSGEKISCGALIMAAGGKSYPALGSDGSCYKLIEFFGHKIVAPVPSAVPLVTKDPLCHILQGQKIFASAKAVIGGKTAGEANGELLFTKYGLSGAAILDVSREISIEINRSGKKDVIVIIDMLPSMSETALKDEVIRRMKAGFQPEELIAGILPNKFAIALAGILKTKDANRITANIKSKEFAITGTRGWNEADFTAGGVNTEEVKSGTLESKLRKGLYFAGEILMSTVAAAGIISRGHGRRVLRRENALRLRTYEKL